MTTNRPISNYTVFPYNPRSSTTSRRKSTRTIRYRLRARSQSTQIQIRRNAQMEFWKLVKPINQASVTTRLYHEVLTEIYKEDGTSESRPGTARSGTGKPSTREEHAIEEAYKQLTLSSNGLTRRQEQKSVESQPLYPQRQDSLLPPPPLAMMRQAYHDRPRRDRAVTDLPLRKWQTNNMSVKTLNPAPLNFSRLDRKGIKERTTPLTSPLSASFPHKASGSESSIYSEGAI